MYLNRALSVCIAENGFVIEINVPIKSKEKKGEVEWDRTQNKQYVVTNAAEIAPMIEKLVPLLDLEYTSEDEFDKAFDKAATTAQPGEKKYV